MVQVTHSILPQAIETVLWPILVLRGTTALAGATASGRAVGAPMALAMASERPWSTAANTDTEKASSKVCEKNHRR